MARSGTLSLPLWYWTYHLRDWPFEREREQCRREWTPGGDKIKPNWNKWCVWTTWPDSPDSRGARDGWESVGRLVREEGIGLNRGKRDGWMDADQAALSPRLVAVLPGASERWVKGGLAPHIQQTARREDRQPPLESRTRTGWPTVKAHGMVIDKERPLRLTAVLHLLNHDNAL